MPKSLNNALPSEKIPRRSIFSGELGVIYIWIAHRDNVGRKSHWARLKLCLAQQKYL